MNNIFKEKNKGAALLMSILIISLVSLASFAIGNVLVSNIALTSAFRNKEEAFWAAEAGIEKGLLFYQQNKEEPELPKGINCDTEQYQMANLDDNSQWPDNSNRVFHLKVCDQIKLDDEKYILEKDQGITFRVLDETQGLGFSWELIDENGNFVSTANEEDTFLYSRVTRARDFETKTWGNFDGASGGASEGLINLVGLDNKLIQLKAFIAEEDEGKKMKVAVSSINSQYIGGPYIYIESIGHYQGVNKRLLVKIDREATSLYNILDYVIFSREDLPSDF